MSQVAKRRNNILLEAGTNELEILVFKLGRTHYGVNVAKVREVIGQVHLVRVPMSHPAVIGVFKLRDQVNPLVDLQLYFNPAQPSTATQRSVILMEFNDRQIGFQVDHVERIYRMSWKDVRPMPQMQSDGGTVITSVCEADGHLALMVDFEKIAFDINGDEAYRLSGEQGEQTHRSRAEQQIILAEDSPTIRGAIENNLRQSGYSKLVAVGNGELAWYALEQSVASDQPTSFTAVVTDIEMPQMDGLCLCRKVKEHAGLKHLPVVVFSSLVSDDNLKKCQAVGANTALTKPQMSKLVHVLDELLKIQS